MSSDKKSSKGKKLPKEALLLSEKPLKEQIGYFSALLERVEDRVKFIAEGHVALDEKVDTLSGKADGLEENMQMVLVAVRSHSTQLQSQSAQIQQLDKKVDVLQKDMTEVKGHLDRVENKLDRVADKVEQHDKDISILKSATALD